MRSNKKIAVIIPALNEELSIGKVLTDIPDWVDDIIVVDNGSKDKTAAIAEQEGARVFFQEQRGYGISCLLGISQLKKPDIVVFLDGDYSDYPQEMDKLVDPIIEGNIDFVIGSRVLGQSEKGALAPQARFGNWLACQLIYLFWRTTYTDLGPFRAIGYQALLELDMQDKNYGWTVEMQIKAINKNLKIKEVPVNYRHRIGTSKVTGTVRGVLGAGYKILATIFIYGFQSYRDKGT
jgi:glycosyltransferase involved in cell wall biosynthesis